jgi:hypothetical protein
MNCQIRCLDTSFITLQQKITKILVGVRKAGMDDVSFEFVEVASIRNGYFQLASARLV